MWILEWTCLPDRVHARDETPATMSHLHDRSVIALAGLVNAIDNHCDGILERDSVDAQLVSTDRVKIL